MRAKTPTRIHVRRLLLMPKLKPVPSVLILSSTRASTGLDAPMTHAAERSAAPIPAPEKGTGFASDEHLTLPLPVLIRGRPATTHSRLGTTCHWSSCNQ
ncbi:unnamed protein product [Musa acuminata subsp. malaccensis]|uniref:(wild Malaysian banana) hypothetical protein n=1 Tax=Musa acuminata subsp. malaccensis TaxID=214687 RepID=A0A8D7FJD1_MUSAM|nr:unnamed protein product [Musa acuminata subsp. malaccensis]